MLVGQIASVQSGTTTTVTTTKNYDSLNRLTSISTVVSGDNASRLPLSFGYQHNQANQRTRVTLADGSYWVYTFDDLGQVTSGKKYWSDGTPVAGQQFEYAFDTIGNRTSTTVGGSRTGDPVRTANYVRDFLNRLNSRDVPAYVDVLGVANKGPDVTVNGTAAYRKGEYYHYPLNVPNSTAQYPSVSVVSQFGGEGSSQSGNVFVPASTESYDYDADGNLWYDGRWSYTWDGENRLVKMESLASGPGGSKRRLEFAYDFMGRRIWSKITNLDTSTVLSEQKFIYDGWNLIAVLNANLSLRTAFVWGTDLSGSMQGAGGVGGLLKVSYNSGNYFTAFDGNGNVAGLINAANGEFAAKYEYGPFGELIRATGPIAKANPFRFSTKYQDDETDLLYYGYRYYNASMGRWLNRDPLVESGGRNLYCIAQNDVLRRWDALGLQADLFNFAFYEGHPAPDPLQGIFIIVKEASKYSADKAHRFVDWCCQDKCRLGSFRIHHVDIKMTLPGVTPERDDQADAIIRSLERAHAVGEAIDVVQDPVGTVAARSVDNATVEHVYEDANHAFLEQKAILWIRFQASVCLKVRCKPWLWRHRADWLRGTTGWRQGKIGMDPSGWFWGKSDALEHLNENIEALKREEFGSDNGN